MQLKTIYLAVAGSLALVGCLDIGDGRSLIAPAAIQLTRILSDSPAKGVVYSNGGAGTDTTAATIDSLDRGDTVSASAGLASAPLGNVARSLRSVPAEARSLKLAQASVTSLTPHQRAMALHYFYGHSDMQR